MGANFSNRIMKYKNTKLLPMSCFVLLYTFCFVLSLLRIDSHHTFYNVQDMFLASLGSYQCQTPDGCLPLSMRWVAGVDINNTTNEVTVYIKENSGVPITRAFVEASVKDMEGYTLKGVYSSPITMAEAIDRIRILDRLFWEYDANEVWDEPPWFICEVHMDEEHGVHIRAAVNEEIREQTGYTEKDRDFLVNCLYTIGDFRIVGQSCLVWVDDLEPCKGFPPATYTQFPCR